MYAEKLINDMPQGLLAWYSFKDNSNILYIDDANEAVINMLRNKGKNVVVVSSDEVISESFLRKNYNFYDYVISIQAIERSSNPIEELTAYRKVAKADAVLLLGVGNRLGIRYFIGDTDPYTGRVADSLDAYRFAPFNLLQKRLYSSSEIKNMLKNSNWCEPRRYSVMPDLYEPQLIYADEYDVKESLLLRYSPKYNTPDAIFVDDTKIYNDLVDNDMFHQMANAYIFECALAGDFSEAEQITIQLDRGKENSTITVVGKENVRKIALCGEGVEQLNILDTNTRELALRGIPVVCGKLIENEYVMPYVDGKLGDEYLSDLAKSDMELFWHEIDKYHEMVLASAEVIGEDDELGILCNKAYLDLVPWNCIYKDGSPFFIDQEYSCDNYPIEAVFYRGLMGLIVSKPDISDKCTLEELYERYGLDIKSEKYLALAKHFTDTIRNVEVLKEHNIHKYVNADDIAHNRERFKYYPYDEYMGNLTDDIDRKLVVLFGAGKYCARFLDEYLDQIKIDYIIDNDELKWETEYKGYKVVAPKIIKTMNPDSYKVIVCVRNYPAIVRQIKALGATNISIFMPDTYD